MPLIFVVSVKKQQPEPSACQLRDLQNALTILNTVSVDVTSFLVTAHLGVLNRTVPRISSLSPFPLFSKAAPSLLGQIFGRTCFPSSGPRGEVSLRGHAQLAP